MLSLSLQSFSAKDKVLHEVADMIGDVALKAQSDELLEVDPPPSQALRVRGSLWARV